MFSNIIKEFLIKKALFKNTNPFLDNNDVQKIKSIALLIDESEKEYHHELIEQFNKFSIDDLKINVLIFKSKIKKDTIIDVPFFTSKDISLTGNIKAKSINDFLNEKYDLQVNYFGNKNTFLSYVSGKTVTKFKAGFPTVDYRLNDLIIETEINNTKEFTAELFKYLKGFNKI